MRRGYAAVYAAFLTIKDNVLIRCPAVSVKSSVDTTSCSDVNVSKLGNAVEVTPSSFLYKMAAGLLSYPIDPMSIFVRPDSPPPRQPSPDIPHTPLPYPHHPRRVTSQPKFRAVSPARPPGLQVPSRTIQPTRSHDHLRNVHSDDNSFLTLRKRTPLSSRMEQPFGPELQVNPVHMSTLTVTAVHRRSSVHVCPVPNPPLPSSSSKRTHLNSFDSLYLPEMDASAIPQRKPPSKSVFPPLKKQKSLSMACLRFFRFRDSSQSQKPATTTFGKH
jgi:hypothetical protein